MTYTQFSKAPYASQLEGRGYVDDFVVQREGCTELVIICKELQGSYAFKAEVWTSELSVLTDYADVFAALAERPQYPNKESISPAVFACILEGLGYVPDGHVLTAPLYVNLIRKKCPVPQGVAGRA